MNGGEIVAEVIARHGVNAVFTLCGGHISPILVGCRRRGIRVVDTRHEATAVFAADASSRLTGVPGVAIVTAGPGVTNSVTAMKNAQLAQSPLVLIGGATAGILSGRGALQDIDQLSLVRSLVKWSDTAERVRDIPRLLSTAFAEACHGVPGPVFLELPVDLLYDEDLVRSQFGKMAGKGLAGWYTRRYLTRRFAGAEETEVSTPEPDANREKVDVSAIVSRLRTAARPVLLLGSQVVIEPAAVPSLVQAIESIHAPVYLSGMARGLLGSAHPLQLRHRRKEALRRADLVLLAGVPADFRLNYGRDIPRGATVIAVNRSTHDLKMNRHPDLAVHADPGSILIELGRSLGAPREEWTGWIESLQDADRQRESEIRASAQEQTEWINPVALCERINGAMSEDSIVVADGGDFVGTASYTVRPRRPLSWLDPGPFGTLGVGAGFALGAAVHRPGAEVWILYGDGSLGFSIADFDTFARHRLPVIAVVANDGCWTQIYREQIEMLKDDTGCMLARTDYHTAVEGLGGRGLLVKRLEDVDATLAEAKGLASQGHAVLVNAWTGVSAFRKGSISI